MAIGLATYLDKFALLSPVQFQFGFKPGLSLSAYNVVLGLVE